MPDTESRFIVSLAEGKIEIAGSEEFVAKQLDRFEELLLERLRQQPVFAQKTPKPQPNGEAGGDTKDLSLYENAFAVSEDKIKILKDLPGTGKAAKTANAAMLLCFAYELRGIDEISFDVVRDVCQAHACLDSSNFSAHVKGEKGYLLVGGSGRKQTVKLTVPGRRKAEELAKSLNVT